MKDTGNNTPAQTTGLLRVEDLMTVLAVSRRTVYRLIGSGALVPIYLDRRPRFLAADVAELVRARRAIGSDRGCATAQAASDGTTLA